MVSVEAAGRFLLGEGTAEVMTPGMASSASELVDAEACKGRGWRTTSGESPLDVVEAQEGEQERFDRFSLGRRGRIVVVATFPVFADGAVTEEAAVNGVGRLAGFERA